MGHDKKVENGQLRFVLLEALGKAAVKSAVPVAVLQQVLQGTYIQQAKSPC
jgi:3-dehydroquinate synthase